MATHQEMTKEEMLIELNALKNLINEQKTLRKNALIFIFEKGLWEEFLRFHIKKEYNLWTT